MADLLPEYEQQFATLSAEITSKICILDNRESSHGSPSSISDLDKIMDEAKDLLEHMELEVRDCLDPTQRDRNRHRVMSHKAEFGRLQAEYTRTRQKTERTELLGGGGGGVMYSNGAEYNDDTRQQLLQDGHKLEITSTRLTRSHQVALETEAIGAEILSDLHHQRSGIEHARSRLREADGELDSSGRVLGTMLRRALQTRCIVGVAVAIVLIVVVVAIWVGVTRG